MPNFLEEAESLFEYTQSLRRDFHRHPELGFQEVRTAGVVARELTALELEVSTGIAKTGVVALIEGAKPGPVVMLRFDMDALPIVEETGAEYASKTEGVMHACGHDAHTAIGLTTARMLHKHREEMAGTVKLVFQPAEEGMGGAETMIKEGVLDNPCPDFALGVHVWNYNPYGWVGITPGPVMAAGEEFSVRIRGVGGHGATPHAVVDPVLASAQVINALQSIVSRNVPPLETAVVSICTIHGGETFNVIPPAVELTGTIRTFNTQVRAQVLERFKAVITGTAQALGCQADIDVHTLTPAVVNDPAVTARVTESAKALSSKLTVESGQRTMGSEDFAYFLQEVPGCFIHVGSANPEKGLIYAHHHPRFDIDERSLPAAAALLATSAWDLLHG